MNELFDWIILITDPYLALLGYVFGFASTGFTIYNWVRSKKMSKEMKKQLYLESQKLINEQSKIMDEGSEIGIHDETAGDVYRNVSERKPLIEESIKFVNNNLDMKIVGKRNFKKFREIAWDSDWIVSNFYEPDSHDVEKTIERKWSIFKQRMRRSQEMFTEIEKEYKAKKIIS